MRSRASHKTSFCFQLSRKESYQSYYSQMERDLNLDQALATSLQPQNKELYSQIDDNFDFD